ncbi:MAG: hypothetical protein ACHQ4H_16415, partial [Ktedonobacterales bacterium]
DTASKVACTGSCLQTWPPLLSSSSPVASGSLSGTLAVLNGSNGAQATYNGHPLYIYSGDTVPGDTKGDGVFGKWHVVTPNVAVNGGGSGGGYGSGY